MLFLNSNATACYMFAVVLVHRISSCSILNSIQCGSVIPFEIARRLSLSLLDEANRIEEDDEVQQITESHHITLTCPSTLMRMEFPGRGFRCLYVHMDYSDILTIGIVIVTW